MVQILFLFTPMIRLNYDKLEGAQPQFHLTKQTIRQGDSHFVHCHDFAEIFWIESGNCIHIINGSKIPLRTGSVVFIRPSDCHGFFADSGNFTILNIAFPISIISFLKERYGSDIVARFWNDATLPRTLTLNQEGGGVFSVECNQLIRNANPKMALDRFLLNIFTELDSKDSPAPNNPAPEWLSRALYSIHDPAHFSGGVKEFYRLAGRSSKHVAREMRKWLNKTVSQYVAEARLDYAAGQLCMTRLSILEIAEKSGFANLTHFYNLFKHRFGMTPRLYRLQEHTNPRTQPATVR